MGFKEAVGWVETPSTRGTCFLVGDRLVITALHVVADPQESVRTGTPVWYGTPIVVYLDVRGTKASYRATALPADGYWGIDDDWVLLVLEDPAEGIEPLRLTRSAVYKSEWRAYGYPEVHPHGLVVSGHVVDPDGNFDFSNLTEPATAMQLHCVQSTPGVAMPIGGLSGAPCLASTTDESNAVYGLIRGPQSSTLDFQPGAILWACPSSTILDACGKLLGPEEEPDHGQIKFAIELLREAYQRKSLVLVLGPGASRLPSTSELLAELIEEARRLEVGGGQLRAITEVVEALEYAKAMQLLAFNLELSFEPFVTKRMTALAEDLAPKVAPLIDQLVGLRNGLKGVITTNLDPDLALRFGWHDRYTASQCPENLAYKQDFVLHLYGILNNPKTWAIEHKKEQDTLRRNRSLWSCLTALSQTCTLLFVGWDLNDAPTPSHGQSLRRLFDQIRQSPGFGSHPHYALYPRHAVTGSRLAVLRDGGLFGVPHDGSLDDFLQHVTETPGMSTGHTMKLRALDPDIINQGTAQVVARPASAGAAVSPTVAANTSLPNRVDQGASSLPQAAATLQVPAAPSVVTPIIIPKKDDAPTRPNVPETAGVASAPATPWSAWLRWPRVAVPSGVLLVALAALTIIIARGLTGNVPAAVNIDAMPAQRDAGVVDAAPPRPALTLEIIAPALGSRASEQVYVEFMEKLVENLSQEQKFEIDLRIIDERSGREPGVELDTFDPAKHISLLEDGEKARPAKEFVRLLNESAGDMSAGLRVVILLWPSDADEAWKSLPAPLRPDNKKPRDFHFYVVYVWPSANLARATEKLLAHELIRLSVEKMSDEVEDFAAEINARRDDACVVENDPLACVILAESEKEPPDEALTQVESTCNEPESPLQARACIALAPDDKRTLRSGCEKGLTRACGRLYELDPGDGPLVLRIYKSACERDFRSCQALGKLLQEKDIIDWKHQLFASDQACQLIRECDDRGKVKILQKAVSVTVSILDEPPGEFSTGSRSLNAYTRFRTKLLETEFYDALRSCGVEHYTKVEPPYQEQAVRMEIGFRNFKIYSLPPVSASELDNCVAGAVVQSRAGRWGTSKADYSWRAMLQVEYGLVARPVKTLAPSYVDEGGVPRPAKKLIEHLSGEAKTDWQERMGRCWDKSVPEAALHPATVEFRYQPVSRHGDELSACWQLTVQQINSENGPEVGSCIQNAVDYVALDFCERTQGDDDVGVFRLKFAPGKR